MKPGIEANCSKYRLLVRFVGFVPLSAGKGVVYPAGVLIEYTRISWTAACCPVCQFKNNSRGLLMVAQKMMLVVWISSDNV